MNVKGPSIAIVDNDSIADSALERVLKENIPLCEVNLFSSIQDFIANQPSSKFGPLPHSKNRPSYQAVFYDFNAIPGSYEEKIEKLWDIKTINRESEMITFTRDILNPQILDDLSPQLSMCTLAKPVSASKEEDYLERLRVSGKVKIKDLNDKKVFNLDFPILVLGGGSAGIKTVEKAREAGFVTHWFSKSLARRKHVFRYRYASIGYEEVMKLNNIEANSDLVCHKTLETALDSKPAFVIMAESEIVGRLPACTNRQDYDELLFRKAINKNDSAAENIMKKGLDANLIIVSNSPEGFAYRYKSKGYNPHKIFPLSDDLMRFKSIMQNKLGGNFDDYSTTLLGTHSKQIFDPRLCKFYGRATADTSDMTPKDKRLYEMARSIVEAELSDYGLIILEAVIHERKRDMLIRQSAPSSTIVRGLSDIRAFSYVEGFGSYYPEIDGFFHGPKLRMDYADFTMHQVITPRQEEIIKEHYPELRELRKIQYNLASKPSEIRSI